MDRNHPRARQAGTRILALALLLGVAALAAGTPTTSGAFHDTARYDLTLRSDVVAPDHVEPTEPADEPVPAPSAPGAAEADPEALTPDDGEASVVVEPTPHAEDEDSAG